MIEALSNSLTNCNELDGNEVVECNGLLTIMKTGMFRFILCAILKLLRTIEPADKLLQTRENGLATALPLIHSVYSCIKDYRSDTIFERVMKECTDLLPDVDETADNNRISKRKVKLNDRFSNFVLMESSGLYSNRSTNNYQQIYFEIFDLVINEMNTRFFSNNSLINVIDKIYNFDFDDINELQIQALTKLNITIPCKEEFVCVKKFFQENNIKKKDYFSKLFHQKVAFKDTYNLLATITVFGCSSATCEASFSTLNRVLTPHRQVMLFGREANLTILPFEKKKLNQSIKMFS